MNKTKTILKKNIKLCFPRNFNMLDITQFTSLPRHDANSYSTQADIGISTTKFGNEWFLLPKGQALFKTFNKGAGIKTNPQMRAINEVLCTKLAKQMGVVCAEYEFAQHGDDVGVVSYNFLKENETLINGDKFLSVNESYLLKENTYACYNLALHNRKDMPDTQIDIEQVLFDIYKVIVFDFLTIQEDRNTSNLAFILKKSPEGITNIRLSPLFDNEFCFGTYVITNRNTAKDLSLNSLLHRSFVAPRITISFNSKHATNNLQFQQYEAEAICKLAQQKPKYKKFIVNALQNFNVGKALQELAAEGIVVSEETLQYYKRCARLTKSILKTAFDVIQQEANTPSKQNANKDNNAYNNNTSINNSINSSNNTSTVNNTPEKEM